MAATTNTQRHSTLVKAFLCATLGFSCASRARPNTQTQDVQRITIEDAGEEPQPFMVRGTIEPIELDTEVQHVEVKLWRAVGINATNRSDRLIAVSLNGTGTFEIAGIPEGEWVLELWVMGGEQLASTLARGLILDAKNPIAHVSLRPVVHGFEVQVKGLPDTVQPVIVTTEMFFDGEVVSDTIQRADEGLPPEHFLWNTLVDVGIGSAFHAATSGVSRHEFWYESAHANADGVAKFYCRGPTQRELFLGVELRPWRSATETVVITEEEPWGYVELHAERSTRR